MVIMSCYNAKGVDKSRISKLGPYKGRAMRPRSAGSELGLSQNMRRAGPGKADTQSPGFAVSDWRAGLPFRDGLLRTLKVGDALNI